MTYILARENGNYIIIHKMENRRVMWLNKDHYDLPGAQQVLANFNRKEI